VLLIHEVISFVRVTIRQVVLPPFTLPMLEPLAKVTYVEAAIAPLVLSEAIWLPELVLALVRVSIAKEISTIAML
jgi:hypothetical protein